MGVDMEYDRTTGILRLSGSVPVGSTITFTYPYERRSYQRSVDIHGNSHADLDRLSELQKLVAKNPQRTDLKMELMRLQARVKTKIGKRKKKK